MQKLSTNADATFARRLSSKWPEQSPGHRISDGRDATNQ
jgi:hypothetical protein